MKYKNIFYIKSIVDKEITDATKRVNTQKIVNTTKVCGSSEEGRYAFYNDWRSNFSEYSV